MGADKNILNTDNLLRLLDSHGIVDHKTVLSEINRAVKSVIRQHEPKQVILPEDAVPLLKAYPDINLDSLPIWIKDNIEDAVVVGNAKQTVIVHDGRRYQLNNPLNHLSGGEWVYFTNSVLNTRYLTTGEDSCAHHIRKIHPTPKPPQLMRDIIEFFTKENEVVLDYFMGVGGSLLGASMCGRRAIGMDLRYEYIKAYKEASAFLNLSEQPAIVGDSLEILKDSDKMSSLLGEEPISLILIDPPYGNMMSKVKTGADIDVYGSVSTPFTNLDCDLGNMDRDKFFNSLKSSVESAMQYLKIKGHIVVFIKDLQPHKKDVNLLHSDIINLLNGINNIQYKGLRVWADQTTKLFPYGYPFSFVANQIHQYILIFRKEK